MIDGHVLPDQVLFTGPTSDNTPYRTLVFRDNLKVTVSFLHAHSKGDDSRTSSMNPAQRFRGLIQCGRGWRGGEGAIKRDANSIASIKERSPAFSVIGLTDHYDLSRRLINDTLLPARSHPR